MAKFTSALCFLALVTSCVAQGSFFSAMTDQVTGTLPSLVSEVGKQQSTIMDGISSATSAVAAFEEQVTSVAQNVITENTGIVEGLITSATGDATSCMAQSIDFKEIVLGYASNAITCAKNALDKLLHKFNACSEVLKNYMNIFDKWRTNTTLCLANMMTFASCVTSVWTSVQEEISNIWASLLSEVTVLSVEFTNFQISLGLCGTTAAVTTLMTEAQKSQAAVAKCVMGLE